MSTPTEPVVATVVIPAYQAAATIAEQLEALLVQDFAEPWELVVVDDGSADETAAVADSYADRFARCRVVRRPANGGVNQARNTGAGLATGDFIVFCDADDVAHPHWLSGLVAALKAADGVGGRIELTTLNSPSAVKRRGAMPYRTSLSISADLRPSPCGGCCGVRREVWEALGGFDERIIWGGDDDTEFFWRLQLAGYRLAFAPDAVMAVRLRRRLIDMVRQQYRYGYGRRHLLRAYDRVAPADRPPVTQRRRLFRRRTLAAALQDVSWVAGHLGARLRPARGWRPRHVPRPGESAAR